MLAPVVSSLCETVAESGLEERPVGKGRDARVKRQERAREQKKKEKERRKIWRRT